MQDVKEEIKARLPIEDVVGQYLELKRSGRNLKGHSPWGVDKTPSFMVSPDKGIWHDFSANKGGDIFTFLMEVEGITFREALERLAEKAGVELRKYSNNDQENLIKKQKIKAVLELACKYYQYCLSKNKPVCEYAFYQRNLDRQTVTDFRIGYAPNGKDFLTNFLKSKGFQLDIIRDAGLLNQYRGDLFRGRLMIPFFDNQKNVIGFTGRIINQGEPKYLNTPETLLFNKSRFIFGLSHAREAIRRSNFAIIAEGNMDIISSHQAGIKEAVATSGTAMTENHLRTISRLTEDVRLAYDSDSAGIKATERAVDLANDLGISLKIISSYHGAKDPDELIRKDPKLWQTCVNECIPAIDWLLEKYALSLDLTSGPGKKTYSDIALKLIQKIPDIIERKHYLQATADKLNVSVSDLLEKKIPTSSSRLKPIKSSLDSTNFKSELDQQLETTESFLEAILVYGGEAGNSINLAIPEDSTHLAELELIYEHDFANLDHDTLQKSVKDLLKRYNNLKIKKEIETLISSLDSLDDNSEETNNILLKIKALRKKIK